MENLNFKKLYDGIHVYTDMFNDVEKTLQDLKSIDNDNIKTFGPWESWYTFGKQRQIGGSNSGYDELLPYVFELENILDKVSNHYMDYYSISKDNTMKMNGHLCKYEPVIGGDTRTLMTMTYHVDFQQEKIGRPGIFHYITCNMYLNDDYVDGQICFSVNNDKFEYKPKAGDVVVFPSTPPYYHGVRKTLQSPKYFFRTFIMKYQDGSEEWLANKEKYGEEIWEQMELEREKAERTGYIKHQDYQQPNIEI